MKLELKTATVKKVETMVDGGMKVVLILNETTAEEKLGIFSLAGVEKIGDIDIKEIEEDGGKSPSQRQRAILYKAWETGSKNDDFETYYRKQMSKLNEYLKEKLLN